MIRTAVRTVSLLLLTSVGAYAQQSTSDLQGILDKVSKTYAGLKTWQFEHRIVVEETASGGTASTVADLTIISAAKAAGGPQGPINETTCAEQCNVELKSPQRRLIIGKNATSAWFYSSVQNEYQKGATLRSVSGSVGGPMVLSIGIAPLMSIDPKQWTSPRLLADETVQLGSERRNCFVVEATLTSAGLPTGPLPPGSPPPNVDLGGTPSAFSTLLQLQGMLAEQAFYTQPAGSAALTKVRVWIDKETSLVLKRTVSESTQKLTFDAPSSPKPLELRLTDTYTVVRLGDAVPVSALGFEPPAGSKERTR